jgi:hypothetical protein
MHNTAWILFLLAFVAYGCSEPEFAKEGDGRSPADRHMQLGENLESQSKLREATFEFTLVAELYPTSEHYTEAVRRAALLFSNPENPVYSDTASNYWFERYLKLPLDDNERELVERLILEQRTTHRLRSDSIRVTTVADSLQGVIRKQGTDASARVKKIQDLEAELARINQELKQLREVDMQMHKNRGAK